LQIVCWFVLRWQLEVTYHEVRSHLGVETQRQWSDLAILRTTPALLGLFSFVTLLAHDLAAAGPFPIQQAAWYPKALPTFARSRAVKVVTLRPVKSVPVGLNPFNHGDPTRLCRRHGTPATMGEPQPVQGPEEGL
jgi:hypothetical protein